MPTHEGQIIGIPQIKKLRITQFFMQNNQTLNKLPRQIRCFWYILLHQNKNLNLYISR